MLVEVPCVQAQGLVERRALVIIEVHGDIDREAEESGPELGLPVINQLGASLEDCREEVSVAVLILAPVLKVLKEGVQLVIGVPLEMPVDGDVAPVSNLLREVGGIYDELGLEKGVLAVLGEESQVKGEVEVRHGLVEEASMSGLITGHENEDLGNGLWGREQTRVS